MQQQERYYPQINSYNKPVSKTSMPVSEAEAWLKQFPQKRAENRPNHGIIQSVADTRELFLRPMSKSDRAVAISKARREHKQALKNLAKQDAQDAKEIAKQLTKWRKEGKKAPTAKELADNKEALRLRRNELNRIRRKVAKKPKQGPEMPTAKGQEVLNELKTHGVFYVADWDMRRKYLTLIMTHARKIGYEIEGVKKGRLVTHYTMNR